jgi:CRP-like cAMP-binding protein
MVTRNRFEALHRLGAFQGLSDVELASLEEICHNRSLAAGEICQAAGQSSNRMNFILSGRIGAVLHVPNYSVTCSEILTDTLGPGDIFGWSALIKETPWSTLKVVDRTEVLYIDPVELLSLCEKNNHLGYMFMKNLAGIISSRLRRHRICLLNSMLAMRGG